MTAAERVQRLLGAARRVADPRDALGARLRERLVESTGLSRGGIELALATSLEAEPSPGELRALLASVTPAPRAHVIAPSNVFVAAHRALALALAASADVRVKPSRREPAFVEALAEAAPDAFQIVRGAGEYAWHEVRGGDHVWAYASDQTLRAVASALPAGAVLHAHGPGFGVAVIEPSASSPATALELARDVVLFEQRGCLSPRIVLLVGDEDAAVRFAELCACALETLEQRHGLGRLTLEEREASAWFRQRAAALGPVFVRGAAAVAVHEPNDFVAALPPSGRNLLVAPVAELAPVLELLRPHVTTAGCTPELGERLARALPRARIASLGRMQSPPFDGPADRRAR
jgi:acyl-CoA reductase-like NAD-dependent aldehyde dehydrogenase